MWMCRHHSHAATSAMNAVCCTKPLKAAAETIPLAPYALTTFTPLLLLLLLLLPPRTGNTGSQAVTSIPATQSRKVLNGQHVPRMATYTTASWYTVDTTKVARTADSHARFDGAFAAAAAAVVVFDDD